ncbi:MAG: PolC-type DNA polymerase III [Eubacterium sp.]|nr:PolC-type DNA polymerase III [Eubacterium sp.]
MKNKEEKSKFITETPLYAEGREVIFGSAIDETPVPISKLQEDDSAITVWGDIFNIDVRNTLKGDLKILNFGVTDYTSSVLVKITGKSDEIDKIIEKIMSSDTLIVKGKYSYDAYMNENIISPESIEAAFKKERMDNAPEKRVELHMHTSFSEMDGISSPKAIINRAAEWGHKAVAITDHGVVQGLLEAYRAAKMAGIKLILGMEGYLVDDSIYPDYMNMRIKDFRRYHITLLVKEDTSFDESIPKEKRKYGRKNLYELISYSNIKTYKGKPLIPKSLLSQKRDSMLIGSACEKGELYRAILEEKSDEELEKIASFYDYLEIQPNGNNAFMINSKCEIHKNINSEEDLININKKIIAVSDKLGKPVVATGDVHFLDENDAKIRAIIMSSKGFEDADNQPPLHFKTTDEMLEDFAWAGDRAKEFVIDNPNKIADMIQDNIPPIPSGIFLPHIDGADEELVEKCWSTAKNLYGDPVPKYVSDRLQRELDLIIDHDFSMHYVIAKCLVEESEKNGYHVGSRGSVGASLVAYFSGISEVNPLAPHYYCKECKHSEFFLEGEYGSGFDLPEKECPNCHTKMARDGHEIPYETFLGFDGDKEPDIDLNFSGEYQSSAHEHTAEIFGKDHVFYAGTIATVADKTAHIYVMKYLEERGLADDTPRAEIDRLAEGCRGIKRTTGMHPGGMIVIPDKYTVEDFTPIQYPANDETRGALTTHFDFRNALHDTVLKLDILGHDTPTMYKYLEELTGISVMDIDLCDSKIYQLFTSTEPIGVKPDDIDCETGTLALPEMGTPFVIDMLTKTKPKNFTDLLKVSGLSHGTDVWFNNAQELIENGICTVSDTVALRDDIMTYLIHKSKDYEKRTGEKSPLSRLDCFRIMEYTRKGKADYGLSQYEEAMREIGVPEWYIDSCKKIRYMFPKAHSVSYIMSALRLAWYKIYYPTEFYAAYFTVRDEEIDIDTAMQGKEAVKEKLNDYINKKKEGLPTTLKEESAYYTNRIIMEMLARGIEFLPVNVLESDKHIYKIENGKIRLPLSVTYGVDENMHKSR